MPWVWAQQHHSLTTDTKREMRSRRGPVGKHRSSSDTKVPLSYTSFHLLPQGIWKDHSHDEESFRLDGVLYYKETGAHWSLHINWAILNLRKGSWWHAWDVNDIDNLIDWTNNYRAGTRRESQHLHCALFLTRRAEKIIWSWGHEWFLLIMICQFPDSTHQLISSSRTSEREQSGFW